jgi:hypothetical protein
MGVSKQDSARRSRLLLMRYFRGMKRSPPRSMTPATGDCWCGCGAEAARGSFFKPGHDKVAESAVINIEYGGVAEFLERHGYGPAGKNPVRDLEAWRARGGRVR